MVQNFNKNRKFYPTELILAEIKNRSDSLKSAEETLDKRIAKAPEGVLRIGGKKSRNCFYFKNSDGREIYIAKKDLNLAKELAQKAYDLRLKRSISDELKFLNKVDEFYKNRGILLPEEQFEHLNTTRKSLVNRIDMTDQEYRTVWESYQYIPKPFKPEDPILHNRKGNRVRSKSEILISNTLQDLGIPFRYEAPLILRNGQVIYPDFTILNVRKRKVYYLEHLGKMHDGDYSAKQMYRFSDYQDSGIFIGEQLLFTYETDEQPFDVEMLMPLVNKYFI